MMLHQQPTQPSYEVDLARPRPGTCTKFLWFGVEYKPKKETLRASAREGSHSYPARIRTWTKRAKISCATVTLPGSRSMFNHWRPFAPGRQAAPAEPSGPRRPG